LVWYSRSIRNHAKTRKILKPAANPLRAFVLNGSYENRPGISRRRAPPGEINLIQATDIQEAAFRILASDATINSQLDYWRSWYLDWNYGFASAIGLDIDSDHLDYSETDVRKWQPLIDLQRNYHPALQK